MCYCYCHYLSQINIFFFFSRRRHLTPSFHLLDTAVLSYSAEYLRVQSHPLLLLHTPRWGDRQTSLACRNRPTYVALTPLPDCMYDLYQPRTTYDLVTEAPIATAVTSSRHCRLPNCASDTRLKSYCFVLDRLQSLCNTTRRRA